MSILSRYILKMFLRAALTILLGLTAIFMVFDILSNAGEITEDSKNSLRTLWHYMALRLPSIFVLVMPMAALLGAMVAMHKMVKSLEMVAIGGIGHTIYKVAGILALGAVLLAIVQFSVSEYVVSDSSVRLRLWADLDYTGEPPPSAESNQIAWAMDGNYIVHYQTASADGHILYEPLIIRRTEDGLIDDYIHARRAFYKEPAWHLEDVYGGLLQKPNSTLKIDLGVRPDDFQTPATTFEEMRLSALWTSIFTGHDRNALHILWFQRKLAQPLSIILMVIMAAPIGLFIARQYNALLVSFGLIMAGFMFFVSERLLLSLGESASLPSFLAVWSPLLIFGAISLWFMLYKQE